MREETVLSLKWHSFPSHLAVSLDTCYEKQQFVDLSLVCKDGTILKCHKMVLANSSPFFRRLLVANDHPHPMIILHDIEADDLKTIINFMYCGEIQVVQSEVRRLLKLAEILEVTGLRHIQTSVLVGESNNASNEAVKKAGMVSRVKPEESRSIKSTPDHEILSKGQGKVNIQSRFSSLHSQKNVAKLPQDNGKKPEECGVNAFNQRLETGKSGISIMDINDMPSTSRGIPNPPVQKRKESVDPVISWPRILSDISKDKPLPLKKLCIMDEVEIVAAKPAVPVPESRRNVPLDRRKARTTTNSKEAVECAVYIKDEIDVPSDMEEDADMDPLEIKEIESESSENVVNTVYPFPSNRDKIPYNSSTHPDFPQRKGSNG